MANVIRAKHLSLDSGILGSLARDFYSTEARSRDAARRFLAMLDTRGWVLLLSWHQFQELIKHRNDDIARARVAFLRGRAMMSWLSSRVPPFDLASIADLFVTEVAIALAHPEYSLSQICDAVKTERLRFGSGAEAIEPSLGAWWALRPKLWEHEARQCEISSISQARVLDDSNEPITGFLNGSVRASEATHARLQNLGATLAAELRERGDRRMSNPDSVAFELMDETLACASPLYSNADDPIGAYLATLGIARDDLDPSGTMRQLHEIAHFRQLLRIAARNLGVPWKALCERIPPQRVPSWIVQRAIRRHRSQPSKVQGGDLTDMYLLCLGLYADLNVVDKRTLENHRRASQKEPEVMGLLHATEKAPNYEALIPRLDRE